MQSPHHQDPIRRKGIEPEASDSPGLRSITSAVGLLIKVSWQLRTFMQFEPTYKKIEDHGPHTLLENKKLVSRRKFREIVSDARESHIEYVVMECPIEKLISCVKTIKRSAWHRRNKDVSDGIIVRVLDARLSLISHSNESNTLSKMFRIFSARCQFDAEVPESLFSNIQAVNIDGDNAVEFFIRRSINDVSKHFNKYGVTQTFAEDCNVLSSILSSYLYFGSVPVHGVKDAKFEGFSESLTQYYLSKFPANFKLAAPALKLHVIFEFYNRGLEFNISFMEGKLAKFFSNTVGCWLEEYEVSKDPIRNFKTILDIAIKAGIDHEASGQSINRAFYSALIEAHKQHDITHPFSSAVGVLMSSESMTSAQASILCSILLENLNEETTHLQFFTPHKASDSFCIEIKRELTNAKGKRDVKTFLAEIIARAEAVDGFSILRNSKDSDRLVAKVLNCFASELLDTKYDSDNPMDLVHGEIIQVREHLENLFGVDVFTRKDWWSRELKNATYEQVVSAKENLLRSYRLCVARLIKETNGNLGVEEKNFFKDGVEHIDDIKRSISYYHDETDDK